MTIEAQLDTIAQHLSEIKRLLATATGVITPTVVAAEPATTPASEPEPEIASETPPDMGDYRNATLDDCIAMATQIVKSSDDGSGVTKLKAIMKNMGAEKVSLLKPSQFAAFMRAAKGV